MDCELPHPRRQVVKARIRDRRLTAKPRIVVSPHGFFNVERLNPYAPGSEVYTAYSLPEAINVAHHWAGTKAAA